MLLLHKNFSVATASADKAEPFSEEVLAGGTVLARM